MERQFRVSMRCMTAALAFVSLFQGVAQSDQSAARVCSRTQQVRRAIRLTTGRVPGDAEVQKDLTFLSELRTKYKLSVDDVLKQYCLLALNANEFVYLD